MILKIALLALVLTAVYFFFFKKKPAVKPKPSSKKEESDDTIVCSTCGTYVPLDDAILSNGKYYCSQECLKG